MDEETARTAAQCRHYAMCKIDLLGTGICPSGKQNHFVSYYPQGRMDIYAALARGDLKITPALVDIADSCNLCGICDAQCHFVTQLRPLSVAKALKEYVEEHKKTQQVDVTASDQVINRFRDIVGEKWVSSDPAHLMAYSNDPCPISFETLPKYVVMPENTEEVSGVVKLCNELDLEFAVRGNGGSVMGFVLSPGVVIDTNRMNSVEFDESNWCVRVGAGVSSFELQSLAAKRGYRVNTAEPSALYCANINCSGIFSLFSSSYGTAADNIVDASFVNADGGVFRLSDKTGPNIFAFEKAELAPPGICTEAVVRLHPVTEDESGIAVPFLDLEKALEYARELNQRGIGIGIGVLGGEYLSTFTAPTKHLAREVKKAFSEQLGINYIVLVLGDRFALRSAGELAPAVLGPDIMRTLMLGMPSLVDGGFLEILEGLEGERIPAEMLADDGMLPVLKASLDPSPEKLASAVDEDLREFYTKLYQRPEMSDMLWLNTFRIVSSRMGRDGHVVAFIVYVPMDDTAIAAELDKAFADTAKECGVRGDLGFITPIDKGRMCVFEWDMYLDHTDPEQVKRMHGAMMEAGKMIEGFSQQDPRILWIRYVFNQGFCRKESFLYHSACGDRI